MPHNTVVEVKVLHVRTSRYVDTTVRQLEAVAGSLHGHAGVACGVGGVGGNEIEGWCGVAGVGLNVRSGIVGVDGVVGRQVVVA